VVVSHVAIPPEVTLTIGPKVLGGFIILSKVYFTNYIFYFF